MYRSIKSAASPGKVDAVAVALFDKTSKLPDAYTATDKAAGGELSAALKRPDFSAAAGSLTTLRPTKGARLVYVLGLGERSSFKHDTLRNALGKLVRAAGGAKVARLDVQLRAGVDGVIDDAALARLAGEALMIANHAFVEFKGAAKKADETPKTLHAHVESKLRKAFAAGLEVGDSVNIARRLAATPPNVASPRFIVSECRRLARQVGLKCSVIDKAKAKQLKLGGLLAVGAAGSAPPAMVVLEHKPARAKGRPVMLVGKAVTFDTGGYSIKPSASMAGMKHDKCGGMAVIGAMHAIARLKLPVHVVGLVPCVENMISTDAYRPDDILTMANGVTVEVTNTDAEGRLILADALAYGTKTYNPAAIVDLATLTGGVVVALGSLCAGCFCGDADLRGRLFDAADDTGERLWHLPLWDEHRDMMKSEHADIVNSGGREAHPIQGAAFLSFFVGPDAPSKMPDLPWAHLDIAGVADVKAANDLYAKGPTGWGVRLLVRAVEQWRA